MRSTFAALGSVAALGLAASQLTDTFVLSQCECPGSEFSAEEKRFFSSPFELAANSHDVLLCFGNEDEFPKAPGFTALFTSEAESTGLSATANGDFFFDGESRSEWYVAIKLDLDHPIGAKIRLLDMKSGSQSLLTVDLETSANPSGGEDTVANFTVASEIAEIAFSGNIIVPPGPGTFPVGIIIGEGTLRDKFGMFAHIVTGVDSEASTSSITQELPAFISLSEEDDLSVEMFSGSTVGDLYELQVHGFQFGRGRFSGFPDSGFSNQNDVLAGLSFAPAVALPSLSRSQIISGVKDESIVVDVTSFLVGGDIPLEDLQIAIQIGELSGTFEKNPPANPFTYTPPKNFVGKQTFFFSYGISQPYACSNSNVSVTISIDEGSSTSDNGDVVTVLLTCFIVILVVVGMIAASRVYRKKRATEEVLAKQENDPKENTV